MIQVQPASEGKCRWLLPAVEIFHDGEFETNIGTLVATPDRLEEAVRNFRVFRGGDRPCLVPGIGIGHDDGSDAPGVPEDLASDDSVESYGEVLRLWTQQTEFDGQPRTLLLGDLGLYGDDLAKWVQAGNLSRVSAELEEQPPVECVGGEGLTLVRVALLGFAPPFLKRLKGLPQPLAIPSTLAFSYSGLPMRVRGVRGEGRKIHVFSDVPRIPRKNHTFSGESGMDRMAALQWLTDNGIDPVSLGIDDSVPDAAVITIVQLQQQLAEQLAKTGATETAATTEEAAQFSDDEAAAETEEEEETEEETATFSGKSKKPATAKFSQINARIKKLERQIAANDAKAKAHALTQARQQKADRVQNVHKFCDRMVEAKKLQPSDCDTASPHTEKSRLLRLAQQPPRTHKFSDKGRTVERDELEIQMEAIEKRQPFKFSQQVAGNGKAPQDAKSHEERHKAWLERRKTEVSRN